MYLHGVAHGGDKAALKFVCVSVIDASVPVDQSEKTGRREEEGGEMRGDGFVVT